MRHRKSGRKLGRDSAHRKAMLRNMVTSLFEHGAIRTTDQKATELRRIAAKMVTLGKKDSLHARRLAAKTLRSREVLVKLFENRDLRDAVQPSAACTVYCLEEHTEEAHHELT